MEQVLMLKYVVGYALAFGAFGVVDSLVTSARSEAGATVDVGMVVSLFVGGALGGAFAGRKSKKDKSPI